MSKKTNESEGIKNDLQEIDKVYGSSYVVCTSTV